jgi:hypothetical protein
VTVGGWLGARTVVAPPALAARVREALGEHWSDDASATHAVCEAAAERVLASLLAARETGRETALDLLAADALVTYAFEHAAELPDGLEARASAVMLRIATLGERYAAPATSS